MPEKRSSDCLADRSLLITATTSGEKTRNTRDTVANERRYSLGENSSSLARLRKIASGIVYKCKLDAIYGSQYGLYKLRWLSFGYDTLIEDDAVPCWVRATVPKIRLVGSFRLVSMQRERFRRWETRKCIFGRNEGNTERLTYRTLYSMAPATRASRSRLNRREIALRG